MRRTLIEYRSVRPEAQPRWGGAWPLVIPVLVVVFEFVWVTYVASARMATTLRTIIRRASGVEDVGQMIALSLGIVACALGICYALEDYRRRGRDHGPIAQLAIMLNGIVILGLVLRAFIAS
jgi:hypothetical protein